MDRKVLLAMMMVMMVLLLDQMISPKFYGKRPKPTTPAGQTGGQAGTAPSPADSQAAAPVAGTTSSTPAAGAPGTLASGSVLTKPTVASAPTEIREIKTEHFRATLTSDGGSIAHWVLDTYHDDVRKQPVDLVPPGSRAYQVIVEAGGKALDFSAAPFRITEDDAVNGVIGFEAQDVSGVRVTKTYRVGRDPRILETDVRIEAPPALGPYRYRIGWGTPLPLTETSTKHDQIQAVALLGTKLEAVPAAKLGPSGERIVPPGNVRWVA
ncbi:MAG TPA: YidC/Oxa1 family insertase periplasmic-domain containing protein, partial [Candidatus Limnocylindrales bacterium]|nr:YidC/Oxa1 family insertase periplasmic-domain containing protein [Candidatus Limnocylindrales bacterium]